MKGWKLVKPETLKEEQIEEAVAADNVAKVKITKALITLPSVLNYLGELDEENNVVLGNQGIGIVSDTPANLFGLEEGKRVYVEPNKPCLECFNCKNNEEDKCSEVLVAGEDYDGFLSNFFSANASKLYLLPDSVSDSDALFIGHVSLAVSIIDKLNVQKGDYVVIVGANNYSNILAQLLIYYQTVPILVGFNEEDLNIAKETGIYYVLDKNDNWQKDISEITGGRMTKNLVYFSDSNIPVAKAFALTSYNANMIFTGISHNNNPISFTKAIKKQLVIQFINSTVGNTASSINLLANKAINFSHLKIANGKYENVPEIFSNLKKELSERGRIHETIVDID